MNFDFPSHYRDRLVAIGHSVARLPKNAEHPLVLLGDSLFEENAVHDLAGCHVLNMGIRGDEIMKLGGGLMSRLHLLPLARPSHVMVLVGINDLVNSRKNCSVLEPQFVELIHAIRRTVPEAQVHVLSVLPVRGTAYEKLMPCIAEVNSALEVMSIVEDFDFVDLVPTMSDEAGLLKQNFTEDGIHLNDWGYDALNAELERHLREVMGH